MRGQARTRRPVAASSLLLLTLAACQTAGAARSQADTDALQRTARQYQECRAKAARDPEYQSLQAHLPLADIGEADLVQMTDQRLISSADKVTLNGWSHDVRQCGSNVLGALIDDGLFSFVPIILADRDRRDAVLVLLAHKKITWGDAVLRLKASRTDMLAGITAESDRRSAEFSRSAEAARANRTALLKAITGLVP